MTEYMYYIERSVTFILIAFFILIQQSCIPLSSPEHISSPEIHSPTDTYTVTPKPTIAENTNNEIAEIDLETPTPTLISNHIPVLSDLEIPAERFYVIETLDEALVLEDAFNEKREVINSGHYFIQMDRYGCAFFFVDSQGDIYKKTFGVNNPKPVLLREDMIRKTDPIMLYPGGLSFDQKWVWYWQGEGNFVPGYDMGDRYSRLETQNLMVISTDLNQGPYPISTNHGGWKAKWSPTDDLIAFSDFDEDEFLQVFTSRYDGSEKIQRTSFNIPTILSMGWEGLSIESLVWSTNSSRLGINYKIYGDRSEKKYFQIIDIESNQLIYEKEGVYGLWWVKDDLVVQWNTASNIKAIEIFDLKRKDIEYSISDDYFGDIVNVFPFIKSSWVGFQTSGYKDLYIYDVNQNAFSQIPFNNDLDYAKIVSTSNSEFKTIQLCKEK